MFKLISKNRGLIILVAVVLASFLWMTSQVKRPKGPGLAERAVAGLSYPFVRTASFAAKTAKNVWGGYIYLAGLSGENARLERENGRLLIQNARLGESLVKRYGLGELRALKEETGYPAVPAEVVGRDASSWFKSVWVNKGQGDGVAKNMPVAVYCGIVGKVIRPYGGSARVMLITDPASAVSCLTERSRDPGILAGDGTNLCRMQYVAKHADVAPGDLIVTSGLDGVFPKGMPVGEVVMVNKAAPGYFDEVEVRPTADLMRLEEVLLISYTAQAVN